MKNIILNPSEGNATFGFAIVSETVTKDELIISTKTPVCGTLTYIGEINGVKVYDIEKNENTEKKTYVIFERETVSEIGSGEEVMPIFGTVKLKFTPINKISHCCCEGCHDDPNEDVDENTFFSIFIMTDNALIANSVCDLDEREAYHYVNGNLASLNPLEIFVETGKLGTIINEVVDPYADTHTAESTANVKITKKINKK